MENQQRIEQLQAIARELGWQAAMNHHWGELTRSDGFILAAHWNKGRIEFSANLCKLWKHAPYNTVNPSITVIESKPAAKIAADIKRRLLPDAEGLWERLLQFKAADDDYTAQIAAVRDRLIPLCDGYSNESDPNRVYFRGDEGYISGEIYVSRDTVDLKLTGLPVETAIQLLMLASKAAKAKAA